MFCVPFYVKAEDLSFLDNYNDGRVVVDTREFIRNKINLEETDKNILKQYYKRLDEYYDYLSNRFDIKIDGWKKLSLLEKVNKLYENLAIIEKSYKENMRERLKGTDYTIYNYLVENAEDNFAEKVNGIEPVIEEKILDGGRGPSTKFKKTDYIYTDKNGQKFIKQVQQNMNSGEESVTFLESGASFPDYDNIFTGDNRSYYDTSSPGMGSTRRPIPSGYKVAKDRSNGKNGKFIIVPEDKSLLPDGAEVKSDGRGGWILTAPESAYKENGNLNLKEDPNLYKKTRYYNKIDIDVSYDRKAINEIVVDESIGIYNPNDLSTSFENTLSMPSKEYEMKNYIYNDNSVFTYETFDDKNLNGEKNENKQELLNKISGYGK